VWDVEDLEKLRRVISHFSQDKGILSKCLGSGVTPEVFKIAWAQFENLVQSSPRSVLGQEVLREMDTLLQSKRRLRRADYEPAAQILFQPFMDYCATKHSKRIQYQRKLLQASNFLRPPDWYPYARLMRRKIIFHGGPTNSGKTYRALQRLRQADPARGGGLYCGPLRLLALEVYQELNRDGVYCSLLTGQDKRIVPGATHASCTIELCDVGRTWDVAVIDEIQLLASAERGSAWTRALLGLQAREVHVCGGLEAAPLVEQLCADTGDSFALASYDRFTPLEIEGRALGSYDKVEPGDAIVAFSRADIYSIKAEIEANTPHRCCVVYGALPSEARAAQAALFNDPASPFDVLVASDAVGLGLNLNIRRVIFHTVYKWNGKAGVATVEPTLVKQIGGRAGRRSSEYAQGRVTCLQEEDMEYLRWAMGVPLKPLTAAGLFPSVEQVQAFAEAMPPTAKLNTLLEKFMELSQVGGRYFLCGYDQLRAAAAYLRPLPLRPQDLFKYCLAPCNTRDAAQMRNLYTFAQGHALGQPAPLNVLLPTAPPRTLQEVQELCSKHAALDLYLWLANHFPRHYAELKVVEAQKAHAIGLLRAALEGGAAFEQGGYDHREMSARVRARALAPANRGPGAVALGQHLPSAVPSSGSLSGAGVSTQLGNGNSSRRGKAEEEELATVVFVPEPGLDPEDELLLSDGEEDDSDVELLVDCSSKVEDGK